MTSPDRTALLTALIRCERPLDELREALSALPPDATPVVMLTREDIAALLRRFQAGKLSAEAVALWAAMVECREDIEFDPRHEPAIADALYDLANPEEPLDEMADDVLALLGQR